MNHSEIAHRWASQWGTPVKDMTLSLGGRSQNVSCHGPCLYSYGTVIGRFCEHKGKPYLLINNRNFSVSTSKHQRYADRATNHVSPVFYGEGDMGTRLDNVTGRDIYILALEKAAEYQAKSVRATTHKAWNLEQAEHYLKEAQKASDFFGLRKKVDQSSITKLAKEKEAAEKRYAKEMALAEKRRAERDATELAAAAQDLLAWTKGEQFLSPHGFHRLPVRLRSIRKREGFTLITEAPEREIETSHGAVIPYEDGRKCYRFCARLWRQGKGWQRNGEKFMVGPYHLDLVTCDGIKAGCHHIHRDEIERFATAEGWTSEANPIIPQSTEETNENTTTTMEAVPPTGEA